MTAKLLLLKHAGGIRFALLGHTLGWWMRSLGFSLGSVTLVGTVFGIPFALKPLLYSAFNARCSITYALARRIAALEYILLLTTTALTPGTVGFFLCAGCAGVCGAVFDATLVGEVRHRTPDADLPTINRNASAAELLGMTFGSTGAFYFTQFVGWQGVYQGLVMWALCLTALGMDCLKDLRPAKTRAVTAGIEFLTRLQRTGYWLVATILVYRIQSASLAQTLQLFLQDSGLNTNTITAVKMVGYLGTYFAYVLGPRGTSRPQWVLTFKTLAILFFAYFAATDALDTLPYACVLAAGALGIEKFARTTDQLMLKELGLVYADKKHAAIQITALESLGMMGRAVGEIISGSLVTHLGWAWFFLTSTSLSVILCGLLLLRPQPTRTGYAKIDSERT